MERCVHCMKELADGEKVCNFCGYDNKTVSNENDILSPGTILRERYYIGKVLGRGGFGITYLAWDEVLRRKVAIKEYLPCGYATRKTDSAEITCSTGTKEIFMQGVEKTLEESRKMAGLTDRECVVNVFDVFKGNNTAYIVMECLEGENLKQRILNGGKYSFEETLTIIVPVLETLEAIHQSGMVHRDISPDNIFLTRGGSVKLLDFGSARVADPNNDKSLSVILKHGYAPLEQYSSKGNQGPWTDVYSICATMYKMLTGITPEESIERVSEDDLVDISELANLPESAAKAIMSGMSIKSKDRIQSAGELLSALTKENTDYSEKNEEISVGFITANSATIDDDNLTKTLYSYQKENETEGTVTIGETSVSDIADTEANNNADNNAEKESENKKPHKKLVAIIAAALAVVILGSSVAVAGYRKNHRPQDEDVFSESITDETSELSVEEETTEETTMTITTTTTTTKKVTQKPVEQWRTAYKNYLLDNYNYFVSDPDYTSDMKFSFAYIDNNSVPELIVSYGSYHGAQAKILTYYNQEVVDLGDYGSMGVVSYIEKEGIVSSSYMGSGCYDETVLLLQNGKIIETGSFSYRPDDSMKKTVYYCDSEEISEEEFNQYQFYAYHEKALKSNINEKTYEIIGNTITKENIKKIETMKIK